METTRSLRQCLIDTEMAHLRVIARLWGLEVRATQPLEAAIELAQALADPENAAALWDALPEEQRIALQAVLAAGGVIPTRTMTRRFGQIRPIGPGRLERETPWRDPISPVEGLWYRGLIYQGFAEKGDETYPAYVVPAELRAALPAAAEEAESALQLETVPAPTHRRSHGDLVLDDLTTLLAFVHNRGVRVPGGVAGAWPASARQALARRLRDADPERLDFLLHLVAGLGWSRLDDEGRLRWVADAVTAWLKGTAAEQRAALVRGWRRLTEWNELWRLPGLQPDETGTWHNDPRLARAALLRHLESLTPGEWVRVEDFVAAIKDVDPDFQRPGGDYETWYIRDAASGEYLTGFESWERVEGALLRALLTGPARWLNLVELGAEGESDPPRLFRRPKRVDPTALPDAPEPAVRADLTIEMPAVRRFQRFQLARVADLVAVGDLYVYRLTPGALKRARRQKIDLRRILDFLDDLSAAPLPQAVRAGLTRWAERGTEIWLERTLLLRAADEETLDEIVASPQAGRYVGRVVGPTAATVAEKDWPKLAAALADLGLLAELVDLTELAAGSDFPG